MSSEAITPLNVVLLWHMHQPEYRDLTSGEYQLPWTYLHAIKDYSDMAAHLEKQAGARAVVNFAPVLLEQIDDYARATRAWLEHGTPIPDPLLNCVVSDERFFTDNAERLKVIQACLRVNEDRLVKRYPPFENLTRIARQLSDPDSVRYLYREFFVDLVVWYHLAWLGETIKRENPVVCRLIDKARGFDMADRRALMEVIADVIAGIIPRYRALLEEGKVELSMSPYAHPMLPLLIDFATLHEAMPDAALPACPRYPEGEQRAQWHVERGLQVFEHYFGQRPVGCWPSEGGVSDAVVEMLDGYGFRWLASGDTVLKNSIHRYGEQAEGVEPECRHHAWTLGGNAIRLFFRDDGLSDLIGFNYSSWHAEDAVGDLLQHLHNIRNHCSDPADSVVSIILDGENAWEYYPENGYYFLETLYQRLAEAPEFQLTTYSEFLARPHLKTHRLPRLVAGSWVYGTFSTWMGDPDKNRAWDLLCDAKQAFDRHLAEHPAAADDDELLRQLAVCEGSDWFWWFGDYNPAGSVQEFDRLYRLNLANLYRRLGHEPPAELAEALSMGNAESAVETGGVMRRGQEE